MLLLFSAQRTGFLALGFVLLGGVVCAQEPSVDTVSKKEGDMQVSIARSAVAISHNDYDKKFDALIAAAREKLERLSQQDQFEKLAKLDDQLEKRLRQSNVTSLSKTFVTVVEELLNYAKNLVIVGGVVVGGTAIWSLYKSVRSFASDMNEKNAPIYVVSRDGVHLDDAALINQLWENINQKGNAGRELSWWNRLFSGQSSRKVSLTKDDVALLVEYLKTSSAEQNQPHHSPDTVTVNPGAKPAQH